MNLPHVFAKAHASLTDLGYPISVQGGSHWLADDPLVLAHPGLFTEDCRYGLQYSGDPPWCLQIPPGEEDPVMTAKVRSKVAEQQQAGRARAASR